MNFDENADEAKQSTIFDLNSEYTSKMGYIQPISILTYNIYDILYNDNNELIIIGPYTPNPNNIKYISYEYN